MKKLSPYIIKQQKNCKSSVIPEIKRTPVNIFLVNEETERSIKIKKSFKHLSYKKTQGYNGFFVHWPFNFLFMKSV